MVAFNDFPSSALLLPAHCSCCLIIATVGLASLCREFSVVSLSHHSVYGTAPKAFANNNYPIYRIMTVYNVVYMSRLLFINIDVSTLTNAYYISLKTYKNTPYFC